MKTVQIIDPQASATLQTVDSTNIAAGQPCSLVDANGRPMSNASGSIDTTIEYFKYSNSAELALDGSTPKKAKLSPGATEIWTVSAIVFELSGSSTTWSDPFGFAGLSGLTNGVDLGFGTGDTFNKSIFGTDSLCPIVDNAGLIRNGCPNPTTWLGTTDSCVVVRFDMMRIRGTYPRLDGSATKNMIVLIQDDLSTLNEFRVYANVWKTTIV